MKGKRTVQEEKESKIWIIPMVLFVYLIPFLTKADYLLYLLNYMGIFMIGAIGIDIIGGCAGQFSIGHAAFMAIGAYSFTILAKHSQLNLIVLMLFAGLISVIFSLLVGLLSLRLKHIYLALATMGFSFIIEEIIVNFGWLTGGTGGLMVPTVSFGGVALDVEKSKYLLISTVVIILTVFARLILNSKMGRAFISIRDSDIAAEICGIDLTRYKLLAFIIGCFYAGIAGAAYSISMGVITPDSFSIWLSVDYLVIIIVGGMGTIYGSILGVIFFVSIPEVIRYAKDLFPGGINQEIMGPITSLCYGIILLIFVVFEPRGIYGRWQIIREYLKAFPLNEVQKKRVRWIRRWR